MSIDRVSILLLALLVTDFVQVYSVFNENGSLFNIIILTLVILSSLLRSLNKVMIEAKVLFVLSCLMMLALNVDYDTNLGLVKSLAIFAISIFLLFNIRIFDKSENIRYFTNVIVILSLTKLLVFVITVDTSIFRMLSDPSQTRFSYSFFFNPIYLARSCGLGFIAAFFMGGTIQKKLLIMFAFAFGLYISGSRGPLLALSVVVLLYLLKLKHMSLAFKILTTILFSVATLGVFKSNFFLRSHDGVETAFGDRAELITKAYQFFLENMLLGSGLGSFSNVSYLGHPHNIILELLAETGIIGLILFMVLILIGLTKRSNEFFWLSLIYIMINSLFSGSIANNIGLLVFSVACLRCQVLRERSA